MTTRDEVEDLFQQLLRLPRQERLEQTEELVHAADDLDADDLAFRTRLELVNTLDACGLHQGTFAPFAHALRIYDTAPAWLTAQDVRRLLWQYKWIVTHLVAYPQIPLDQLQDALEGMRRRYEAAGQGLGPVLGCAYVLRAHVDGRGAAEAEYDAWRRAPRTSLSDCEACEPTRRIQHLTELGRHEEALAELAPVLQGRVGCREQPHSAVAQALVALVTHGDPQAAARLHRSAYRASASAAGQTEEVARHVHLLARTRNLTRGVELLERHLPVVDRPANPLGGMELAAAGACLLRAVAAAGDADLPVQTPAGPVTAADLADDLESRALTVARAFDERNGTSVVGARMRSWIAADPLPALPLGPLGSLSAARRAAPVLDLPRIPRDPAFGEGAEHDLDTVELAELAARARLHAHEPTWVRVAAEWRARRPAVVPALDGSGGDAPTPQVQRAVADLDAFVVALADDPEPELAASAAARFRALGDEAEALLVEHAARRDDLPAEHGAALVAAVDAHGTPEQRARARLRVARLTRGGRAAAWRADAVDVLAGVEQPSPLEAATLADALADGHGEGDRAAVLARVDALLANGELPATRAQVLLERAMAMGDDVDARSALVDEAAAVGRDSGAPAVVLQAEYQRAHLHVMEGDHERAEALAVAVAAAALDEGLSDACVATRILAIRLMAGHGRDVEALELAESTLVLEHRGRPPRGERALARSLQRSDLLEMASRLSAAIGERDRAVHLAREALALATGPDGDAQRAATAGMWLAELVGPVDAVEATRLYADAVAAADGADLVPLGLSLRRARLWARFDADGMDAALADLADAERAGALARARAEVDPVCAAALGRWDFDVETLNLATLRARLLGVGGDVPRALDAVEGVPERWAELGHLVAALDAQALLGALLLEDGQDRGLAVLEDVVVRARSAGAHRVVSEALGSATSWLDRAGRPEEARALWERHADDASNG